METRKHKLGITFDFKEVSLQYPDAENATYLEYCFDEDELEKLRTFFKAFDCVCDIDTNCGITADAVRLCFKYDTPDETIKAICEKAIEWMWRPNYILLETIEREISEPKFFYTYEDAYHEMEERFYQCNKHNGYIDNWTAYCENANHDNCDWKIFELK